MSCWLDVAFGIFCVKPPLGFRIAGLPYQVVRCQFVSAAFVLLCLPSKLSFLEK